VQINPSILSKRNIDRAINSFKQYKSPGPDGITPAKLIYAGSTATHWLQKIFSEVVKMGYIPETCGVSKVVFISKAGMASQTSPKDIRPISLSSFMLKTFERPLDGLSNSQHAYRKGRSTETATVVATVEKFLHCKEYTLIDFFDIKGAFNNVTPEAITGALSGLGVESPLAGLINQ